MKFDFKKWQTIFLIILVGVFLLLSAGCSGSNKVTAGTVSSVSEKAEMTGTIRVSGAWALYPMMVKWAEEYQNEHPGVRIDVSAGGAGKGVADALSGMVDIGMVSREIKPEEVQKGGYFVPVVKDAVFPTINANNPVVNELMKTGIKRKTFVDLWIGGKKLSWGDVIGTASTESVNVYTRSDSCGAGDTWALYLGGTQEKLKGIAVYGDPGLADAMRNDKLGIGYNNLNYAYDAKSGKPVFGILVVPVDVNENGKIDAQEVLATKQDAINAIQKKAYPSPPARDLYLITKNKFEGPAQDFVSWILTDGQKYVEEVGYIQLTDSQLSKALNKVR